MEGREERDPGYDDWFDEPEPPPHRGTRAVFDDEDAWVVPSSGERHGRSHGREPIVIAGHEVGRAQLAIVGVCAIAIVVAILAAAGAFGGGKTAVPPLPKQTSSPPNVSSSVTTPANTAKSARGPTVALKPGDTGTQVTALQKALTTLGFSPGKADGDYGPATQVAVEHFQAANNLGVDGVFGPKTLAALQKALSG